MERLMWYISVLSKVQALKQNNYMLKMQLLANAIILIGLNILHVSVTFFSISI